MDGLVKYAFFVHSVGCLIKASCIQPYYDSVQPPICSKSSRTSHRLRLKKKIVPRFIGHYYTELFLPVQGNIFIIV